MSLLFLDIETYVSKGDSSSGLNPYRKDSKVIAISYAYYQSFTIKKRDIKELTILKEWEHKEGGEKIILKSFYDFLKSKIKSDRYTKDGKDRCGLTVIGFNHISFDLPYLFVRMCSHNLDVPGEIYKNLFSEPMHTDLMQLTQLVSKKSMEYEKLMPLNQKLAAETFKLTIKEGEGKDLSNFYDDQDYGKIEKYIKEEFTFEQMYLAFIKAILNPN
jgi:hypothetical protein